MAQLYEREERSGQFLNGASVKRRKTGNELADRTGGIHLAYRRLVNAAADLSALQEALEYVCHVAGGSHESTNTTIWIDQHEYNVAEGNPYPGLPRGEVLAALDEIRPERREAYGIPVSVLFPTLTGERDAFGNKELRARVKVLAHPLITSGDLHHRMQHVEQGLVAAIRAYR